MKTFFFFFNSFKLQNIIQQEACKTLQNYYLDEQKLNAAECKVSKMKSEDTKNLELLYQKKVEVILEDEYFFKIIVVCIYD